MQSFRLQSLEGDLTTMKSFKPKDSEKLLQGMKQEFRAKRGTCTSQEKVNQNLDIDKEQDSLDATSQRIELKVFKYLNSPRIDQETIISREAYIGLSCRIQKATEKGNQRDVTSHSKEYPSGRVTGRKARGPPVAGGNKLQVEDGFFFPSLHKINRGFF